MIVVIAPEPVPWLGGVLARTGARVIAPWASWAFAARVPGPVGRFFGRRQLAGDRIAIPGWSLIEAGLRTWAGGRTARTLASRLAVRAAVDALAATILPGLAPEVVIAPSCAARQSLARARRLGARTILLEDLPDLFDLHRDLDQAGRFHPDCRFLNNYRAPGRVIANQRAERVLADELWVRGRYAETRRRELGFVGPIGRVPLAPTTTPRRRMPHRPGHAPRIRLAGLACARHGTVEALDALTALPGWDLLVRPGEGLEPIDLLDHPRVFIDDGGPVTAVLAPAWCESYPAEVMDAARDGIPVIATSRAAGDVAFTEIPVGSSSALVRALADLVGKETAPCATS